jgi:hypothetical protein
VDSALRRSTTPRSIQARSKRRALQKEGKEGRTVVGPVEGLVPKGVARTVTGSASPLCVRKTTPPSHFASRSVKPSASAARIWTSGCGSFLTYHSKRPSWRESTTARSSVAVALAASVRLSQLPWPCVAADERVTLSCPSVYSIPVSPDVADPSIPAAAIRLSHHASDED